MKEGAKTFYQFCAELGIVPPRDLSPGRWTRCGTAEQPSKKNASVFLEVDGVRGYAQDWASMSECAVWISGVANDTNRKPEYDHEAAAKRLAFRREQEVRGTMRAATLYAKSAPLVGPHPYLTKKRITAGGLRGVRVDSEGWLVIPMMRDGRLMSVQRISPEGQKKFSYGAPVKHTRFVMMRPGFCLTVVAEGFATAATVFEACPLARVVVCFSAANLIEVAKRESWSGSVAVAGDNDLDTEERLGRNPGAEAAKEAAQAIGCGYALPTIPTDYNDMFCEQLERLEAANAEKSFPATPIALRRGALAPVQSLIMRAAKKV